MWDDIHDNLQTIQRVRRQEPTECYSGAYFLHKMNSLIPSGFATVVFPEHDEELKSTIVIIYKEFSKLVDIKGNYVKMTMFDNKRTPDGENYKIRVRVQQDNDEWLELPFFSVDDFSRDFKVLYCKEELYKQ